MIFRRGIRSFLPIAAAAITLLALPAFAAEVPDPLPDSGGSPVKVFILSGQSNMVGAGKVTGGNSRWGSQFIEPVVSVYEDRETINGLRFTYEPPELRFFQARFEPLS